MFEYRNLLLTTGVSFVVSSFVVLINNYYLYKHSCKLFKNIDNEKYYKLYKFEVDENKMV
jgi:hypothetical protein